MSKLELLEEINFKMTIVKLDLLTMYKNLETGLLISVSINAVLVVLSIYLIRKDNKNRCLNVA